MAHREDITSADLLTLGKMLQAVAATTNASMKPGIAFETATFCIGTLEDVVEAVFDLQPKLQRVSLLGPSYFSGGTTRNRSISLDSACCSRAGNDGAVPDWSFRKRVAIQCNGVGRQLPDYPSGDKSDLGLIVSGLF
jgi:hypothetical protein